MYPYPPLPVPPPPPTPLKKKKIETDTVVEKDLVTMNSMIHDIRRDAGECVKTAILEENWEEKQKLLLEEFIRQEEENKYNLDGQEEQILDSFLSSKTCKIKNKKKPVDLPPPPPPPRKKRRGRWTNCFLQYFPYFWLLLFIIVLIYQLPLLLWHPGPVRLLYPVFARSGVCLWLSPLIRYSTHWMAKNERYCIL